MKTSKFTPIGLVALLIFSCSQQALSQDTRWAYGAHYQSFINTLVTNNIYVNPKTRSNTTKPKTSVVSPSSDNYPTTLIVDPPKARDKRIDLAVQFKSTGTRLMVKELAELVDPVPEDRAETGKMLSGILDKYETEARANGYREDFALAIVSSIHLLAYVHHGQPAAPYRTTLHTAFLAHRESRDALAEHLFRDGSIGKMTDRQKQESYEFLIMIAGFYYHRYEIATKEKNAEELKYIKLHTASLLESVGVNV
jgi:hypothetical protein